MNMARTGGLVTMLLASTIAASTGARADGSTLMIATVNNGDMIVMQKLSPQFEEETGIKLNWQVLEENVLRQKLTVDVSTNGGLFDVMTIGAYETPIRAKQGWLMSLDDLGDAYDYADIIQQVRQASTVDAEMYAALEAVRPRRGASSAS